MGDASRDETAFAETRLLVAAPTAWMRLRRKTFRFSPIESAMALVSLESREVISPVLVVSKYPISCVASPPPENRGAVSHVSRGGKPAPDPRYLIQELAEHPPPYPEAKAGGADREHSSTHPCGSGAEIVGELLGSTSPRMQMLGRGLPVKMAQAAAASTSLRVVLRKLLSDGSIEAKLMIWPVK